MRVLYLLTLAVLLFFLRRFSTVPYCLDIDEAFSLYYSQVEINTLFKVFETENNSPLWELMLRVWFSIVHPSIENARLLSNLFYFLTIIPLYKIGASFLNKRIGVFSVIIFLLSNFVYYISNYARVYSFTVFLAMVSVYIFLKVTRDIEKSLLMILAVINALLLYTHYSTISLVVLESAGLLWLFSKMNLKRYFFVYVFVLGILLCPQLGKILSRFMSSGIHGTWVQPVTGLADIYHMICKGFNLPLNAVFFIILWIISVVLIYRHKLTLTVEVRWIIFFWGSIWTAIYIYSFWVGLFFDKYMVFTFPLLYISTAYMLDVLSDRLFGKSTLLPVAFIITMLLTTRLDASQLTYHGEKYDYKKLAECIHRLKLTKAERIFIQGVVHEKPLMYYYDNENFFNNVQNQNSSLVFKCFEREHIFFTENIESMRLEKYDFVVSTYPLTFDDSSLKEIGNFYIYFNHKTKG